MIRYVLIVGPLLALVACGPAEKSKSAPVASTSAPTLKPGLVRPDGTTDYFTPHEGGALAIDEYSVGPIMAQTAFSMEAIKPRFPKAKVEGVFMREDDGQSTLMGITVSQDGGEIEISGNPGSSTVGDIRVVGGAPAGPRGETLGMKWADADMDYERCRMGEGRDRYAVICLQPGEPVLRYVFSVSGWAQDTLPPAEALRQKAVLHEFLWRGGAPVMPPAVP